MIRWLNRLQPCGLCFLRIVLGAAMLYHGTQKLIPTGGLHRDHLLAGAEAFTHYVAALGLPYWLGYVSLGTEFFGGIFLLLGFLTRLTAFLVAVNMLVAIVTVNIRHGYAPTEYSLALCSMATLLILAGSGALSLDRRLGLS